MSSVRTVVSIMLLGGLASGVWAEDVAKRAEATISGTRVVVVARLTSGLNCTNPMAWRWGAEGSCPSRRVSDLEVKWGEEVLFVPLSAYSDLANLSGLQIEARPGTQRGRGFIVSIKGGDAATSYRAVLEFAPNTVFVAVLKKRAVRHGAFPERAWEETTYSYNDDAEPIKEEGSLREPLS